MYEVFFNERKIVITELEKITINKTSVLRDNFQTKEAIREWFLEFSESEIPQVILLHPSPKYFFENLFQPIFKVIYAAGGVVKRGDTILFIFRNGKWDLPKGKVDMGETVQEAAKREVEEECGILGHEIIKKIHSTFHIYQSPHSDAKGQWIFKETVWFEMKYKGLENGSPQAEENITLLKWFKQSELDSVLRNTYENLKQTISYYLTY